MTDTSEQYAALERKVSSLEAQLAQAEQESEQQDGASSRWRNTLLGMIAAVLWIGQWGDVIAVGEVAWHGFLSKFTNEVEYEVLAQINVGMSAEYFHDVVGKPKIIKPSNVTDTVHYEYIFTPKYLLIGLLSKERVVGYSVVGLTDGFAPEVPFAKFVTGDVPFAQMHEQKVRDYASDNVNLAFYMESQSLGLAGLYMKQALGYVNYSGVTSPHIDDLKALTDIAIFGGNNELEALQQVRTSITPNFYAITETDVQLIADALLTKYEFNKFR